MGLGEWLMAVLLPEGIGPNQKASLAEIEVLSSGG
jgi:hypothetical protein